MSAAARVPANFVLGMTAGEGLSKTFNEGVAASAAGNFDEAIAKFNEALKTNPQCSDCYYNIGVANAGKKDYDKAEEAYKKAIEVKPSADAYNGLASVYTSQRKFDLAPEAGEEGGRAGGGGPWRRRRQPGCDATTRASFSGTPARLPRPRRSSSRRSRRSPITPRRTTSSGMALVNEGNLKGDAVKEFDTYIKLAPNGPNASPGQGARRAAAAIADWSSSPQRVHD